MSEKMDTEDGEKAQRAQKCYSFVVMNIFIERDEEQ